MRLNVEIKDDIYTKMADKADSEGRSISDVIRVLINDWLKKEEEEDDGTQG